MTTEEKKSLAIDLLRQKAEEVGRDIAWATLEARTRLLRICEANLRAYLEGCPQNVVS